MKNHTVIGVEGGNEVLACPSVFSWISLLIFPSQIEARKKCSKHLQDLKT